MAADVIGALRVVLGLDSAAFEKGLTAQEKELKRFGKNMSKIGDGIAIAGAGLTAAFTLPMLAFGKASIQAAKEAKDALGQVEASLASMGGVSRKTLADLQSQADALMKASLFDDDDILRSVTANLLTFGNVAGQVFDRAQVAIVDVATKLRMDLQSATILVGKALNDPVKGLQAMGRAGIQFTASQKELIKSLVATGKIAEAQTVILAELERQYGGSAKAAQAADPVNQLNDALDTLQETIGEKLLPLTTPFIKSLTNIANGFANMSPQARSATLGIAGVAAAAGPALIAIGSLTSAVSNCGPLLRGLATYFKGAAAAASVLSVANLRLTFTTTALTAAFAGQNTAMALLVATGRTLGVVMTGLGRVLLALVGGPIGLAIAGVAALGGGLLYLQHQHSAAGMAARANDRAHQRLDPIIQSVKRSMDLAAGSAGAQRDAYLATARAAFQLGEQEIAAARKTLAAARARIEAARQTEAELAMRGANAMPGYNTGQAELRALQAQADLKAAEDRLIEAGLGRRRGSRGRGTTFVLIDPADALREAEAMGNVTNAVTDLGGAAEKTGRQTETAADKAEKLRDAYGQLIDRYMSPEEREAAQLAEDYKLLSEAFDKGAIKANELARALRMMSEARERANFDKGVIKVEQSADLEENPFGGLTTYRGQVMSKETAEELKRQTTDVFRGALDALRYGGTKGVFEYLADTFANRLLDRLADQLTNIFDQILGSLGGGAANNNGGLFGSIFGGFNLPGAAMPFGKLPGFATGGSFQVGGFGGIDSQLTMFRATPGEMVNITHGNDNGGRRATNVFDMRGAVVTQDLLDQMNRIAAMGDAAVIGAGAADRQRSAQKQHYRARR